MAHPKLISMSPMDGARFRVVLRLSLPARPAWIVAGVLDKRAGTFRPEGALVRLGAGRPGEQLSLDVYWEEDQEPLAMAQVEAWARQFAAPRQAVRAPVRAA